MATNVVKDDLLVGLEWLPTENLLVKSLGAGKLCHAERNKTDTLFHAEIIAERDAFV